MTIIQINNIVYEATESAVQTIQQAFLEGNLEELRVIGRVLIWVVDGQRYHSIVIRTDADDTPHLVQGAIAGIRIPDDFPFRSLYMGNWAPPNSPSEVWVLVRNPAPDPIENVNRPAYLDGELMEILAEGTEDQMMQRVRNGEGFPLLKSRLTF
jgi:hypothetical protein